MRCGFLPRLLVLLALAFSLPLFTPARLVAPADAAAFQDHLRRIATIIRQSDNVRHTNDQATIDRLDALNVNGVRWANRDIKAVAADLETWSKQADSKHVGIHFVVKLPADPAHPDVLDRPVQRLVCVILTDKMSFKSLLWRISESTNLAYHVDKGCVTLEQWQPDDFFEPPDQDL